MLARRRGWVLQLVLFAVVLILVATEIDPQEVGDAFKNVRYEWLAVALLIYICSRLLHTVEWQITHARVGKAPFFGLFAILLVGTLVNAIVPASAGDIAKIQLAANRYHLPRAGLVARRGAEAIVNALIMVLFIAVSFALPGAAFGSVRLLLTVAVITVVVFVVAVIVSHLLGETPPHWLRRDPLPHRLREGLASHWPRIRDGLAVIRQPRLLGLAVALNLIGWMADILILWAYGEAFHLDVPFAAYVSLSVVIGLITTFPVTFGNVGTWELGLLGVLTLYSVPNSDGLAYAVGTHVFGTVFNIGLGILAMLALRVLFTYRDAFTTALFH
jgi:uncharacterized protein (TIRG00374 family)